MAESMMLIAYNNEGVDLDKVDEAVARLLAGANSVIDRSNTFFGRKFRDFESREARDAERKAFFADLFRGLKADFTSEMNEALKIFNSALPESLREQNKNLVNA